MKKNRLIVLFLLLSLSVAAQDGDFEFGKDLTENIKIKTYPKDTSAVAVVLNEFGYGYIDTNDTYDLIYEYHVKIKILRQPGVTYGNIEIPLQKDDKRKDRINWIKASSYNLGDKGLSEDKLQIKNVFIDDPSKYYDVKKFAIPNVKVGTIIEYKYQLQTPFIFNFYPWEFQSDIPKVKSEYWAKIPGNYIYNISLRGPLELTKSENKIMEKCATSSYIGYGEGSYANCLFLKFGMTDIPTFVEEEFMTAKSNFLSTINFELSEVRHFSGEVDKVTKEWKDADGELEESKDFGLQIKRSKSVFKDIVDITTLKSKDSLSIAKELYDFIKFHYQWNDTYGKYTEFGIKQAFDSKKGNVGDINLSLVAILQQAGLNAAPIILSTRANGLPIEIYPVISDFNYVIAKLKVQGKDYLLDATDDYLPFGTIPIRCINGKGRVMDKKGSYWIELKPTDKSKTAAIKSFKINDDGSLTGTIQNAYYGYAAIDQRKSRAAFATSNEYINHLRKKYDGASIANLEEKNMDSLEQPYIESFQIDIESDQSEVSASYLLNPFLTDEKKQNPFKLVDRLYPVDYGAPIEEFINVSFEFPSSYSIEELPTKIAIAIPNNAARYVFDIQQLSNKIIVNHKLQINKPVYTAEEYHYLKELYARIIQAQNSDVLFKIDNSR